MRGTIPRLLGVEDVLRLDARAVRGHHTRHLNPRLTRLLAALEGDRRFVRAQGVYAWDQHGRRYLDFLAGFGALGLGHNHPRIHAALDAVRDLPNLIEEPNPFEGALAHNLIALAPAPLRRVHFECSGTEAIDAAIKLARAATGRVRLVACENAFHGRSVGALSITSHAAHRRTFGPLLPEVTFVPFGDAAALEAALRRRDAAAFIVEPIQAEAGIAVPPPGYLVRARELCTCAGTLLVADEIQVGLGRTGALFASAADGAVPDVLLLGKTLGGGLAAISAVLTTEAAFRAAGGGTSRTPFHSSTFGGNPRACATAIATLEVIVEEDLPRRSRELGEYLLAGLRALQRVHPVIAAVRGSGLLAGVELAPSPSVLGRWAGAGLARAVAHEYLPGLLMMRLLQDHHVLTAFTLNQPSVLRLEPPLIVERDHIDAVLAALDATLGGIANLAGAAVRATPALLRSMLT